MNLDEMRARHRPYTDFDMRDGAYIETCRVCEREGPCDAARALDAYATLEAAARHAIDTGDYAPLVALLEKPCAS